MTDYSLCGWRLSSELPLPELAIWEGDQRPPQVTIALGPTPEPPKPLVVDGPFAQLSADGTLRFSIEAVGRFLVRGDGHVTVAPHPEASGPQIRAALFSTPFATLCHQRGVLPFHASCVVVNGRAVAITGISGAGKSTLAALMACRGHPLLAEDVCVLDCRAEGGPLVLPSPGRLKLWRDTVEALGLTADPADRIGAGREKFDLARIASFHPHPLPLAAVIHLSIGWAPQDTERLRGTELMRGLKAGIFRERIGIGLGKVEQMFAASLRLAALPNWRISRSDDFAKMDALADLITELAGRPS